MKTRRVPSRQITTSIPLSDHRAVMAEVRRLDTNRAEWLRALIAEWARKAKAQQEASRV